MTDRIISIYGSLEEVPSDFHGTARIENANYIAIVDATATRRIVHGSSDSITYRPSAAALGKGSWTVNGVTYESNGSNYVDSIASNTKVVALVTDLEGIPSNYTTAIVKDDLRGGIFNWSATGTVDGGITFAGATGYWVRSEFKAIDVRWFNTTGEGLASDTVAVQSALNATEVYGVREVFGHREDVHLITETLRVPAFAIFNGRGVTLKSHETNFSRGTLVGLTAMLANKNADYTAGEATDEGIEICNIHFSTGSNLIMDSVYIANTKGCWIHHCTGAYQPTGQYLLAHVDVHHSNTGGVVELNDFSNSSEVFTRGACTAVRNSNSVAPSNNNIIRNNKFYKNCTANTDEFLWVNGGTGAVSNTKILDNYFESGPIDATSSVITVYPYTNSGAIATSEVINTVIEGNTFSHGNSVAYVVLVGYTGETRPCQGVKIRKNYFDIGSIVAIKTLTACSDLVVEQNTCKVRAGEMATSFYSNDGALFETSTAIIRNNTMQGSYAVGISGGYAENNTIESVREAFKQCRTVIGNRVTDCNYQFSYSALAKTTVRNNDVIFNNYFNVSTFPYFVYISSAETIANVRYNNVTYAGNGFKVLRSHSSGPEKISFDNNVLSKNGATDSPDMQLFSLPFKSSLNNEFWGVNTTYQLSTDTYGVAGFVPAVGQITHYIDIAAGTDVAVGKMRNSVGATITLKANIA